MTPEERQYEADLCAEIVQLKAERDALRVRVAELESLCTQYRRTNDALIKRIGNLEAALRWYADDHNYWPPQRHMTEPATNALEGKP